MSLWHCAVHGTYGGSLACPSCGAMGAYVTLASRTPTEAEPGEAEVERRYAVSWLRKVARARDDRADHQWAGALFEAADFIERGEHLIHSDLPALRSTTPAVAVDDDALVAALSSAESIARTDNRPGTAATIAEARNRLQSLQASVRVKDEALRTAPLKSHKPPTTKKG